MAYATTADADAIAGAQYTGDPQLIAAVTDYVSAINTFNAAAQQFNDGIIDAFQFNKILSTNKLRLRIGQQHWTDPAVQAMSAADIQMVYWAEVAADFYSIYNNGSVGADEYTLPAKVAYKQALQLAARGQSASSTGGSSSTSGGSGGSSGGGGSSTGGTGGGSSTGGSSTGGGTGSGTGGGTGSNGSTGTTTLPNGSASTDEVLANIGALTAAVTAFQLVRRIMRK